MKETGQHIVTALIQVISLGVFVSACEAITIHESYYFEDYNNCVNQKNLQGLFSKKLFIDLTKNLPTR